MKKKLGSIGTIALLAGLALPALNPTPLQAQAQDAAAAQTLEQYLKAVRGDLIARRDSALHALLQMNEAEAEKFWPLQKEYDKEAQQLGKARLSLLREYQEIYDKLTPETAAALADKFFKLHDERDALRRKYFKRMSEEVSIVVAVQFLQLQGQFETMGDLKLATYVPLAVE